MSANDADRVIAVLSERIDTLRGDFRHLREDHERRLKSLETSRDEQVGVWKVLTAGGVVGGSLVIIAALVARSLGA